MAVRFKSGKVLFRTSGEVILSNKYCCCPCHLRQLVTDALPIPSMQVTIAGVVNSICNTCNDFNGTFIVPFAGLSSTVICTDDPLLHFCTIEWRRPFVDDIPHITCGPFSGGIGHYRIIPLVYLVRLLDDTFLFNVKIIRPEMGDGLNPYRMTNFQKILTGVNSPIDLAYTLGSLGMDIPLYCHHRYADTTMICDSTAATANIKLV